MALKTSDRRLFGHPLVFERRRYGTKIYTWALLKKPDGELLPLGDPWPAVTPKASELREAAARALGLVRVRFLPYIGKKWPESRGWLVEGFATIQEASEWILENLSDLEEVRVFSEGAEYHVVHQGDLVQ